MPCLYDNVARTRRGARACCRRFTPSALATTLVAAGEDSCGSLRSLRDLPVAVRRIEQELAQRGGREAQELAGVEKRKRPLALVGRNPIVCLPIEALAPASAGVTVVAQIRRS